MTNTGYEHWNEAGFDEWRKLGFESDYVKIDPATKTISPAFEASNLLRQGFLPKGSKVKFVNHNGYESEREHAASVFNESDELTVEMCRIGNSSSTYKFEGIDGNWNTVMFEASPPPQQ